MHKYPDFTKILLGNGPLGFFFGFVVIAIICAFVSLLIEVNSRDIKSTNTPEEFSYKFMLVHNLLRILANILLIPIFIRISYEWIPMPWMLLVAVGIGAGSDRLGLLLKNIGVLTTNKLASKVADKINNS